MNMLNLENYGKDDNMEESSLFSAGEIEDEILKQAIALSLKDS
jgi:hypothetical protein